MVDYRVNIYNGEDHEWTLGSYDTPREADRSVKAKYNSGFNSLAKYIKKGNTRSDYMVDFYDAGQLKVERTSFVPPYATELPVWQSYDHISFGDRMDFDYERLLTRNPISTIDTIQITRVLRFPQELKDYIIAETTKRANINDLQSSRNGRVSNYLNVSNFFLRKYSYKTERGRIDFSCHDLDNWVDNRYNRGDSKYPGKVELRIADPDTIEYFKERYGDRLDTYMYDFQFEVETTNMDLTKDRILWKEEGGTEQILCDVYDTRFILHKYIYLVCCYTVKTDMNSYEPDNLSYIRSRLTTKYPDFYRNADFYTDLKGEYYKWWKEYFDDFIKNFNPNRYSSEYLSLHLSPAFLYDRSIEDGKEWPTVTGYIPSEDIPDSCDMPEIYYRKNCPGKVGIKDFEKKDREYNNDDYKDFYFGVYYRYDAYKKLSPYLIKDKYRKVDFSQYNYVTRFARQGVDAAVAKGSPFVMWDDNFAKYWNNYTYGFWHFCFRSPMHSLLDDAELLDFIKKTYFTNGGLDEEDIRRDGDDLILIHHKKPWIWRACGQNGTYIKKEERNLKITYHRNEKGKIYVATVNFYEDLFDRKIKTIYSGPHIKQNLRIEWKYCLELVKMGWWGYDMSLANTTSYFNDIKEKGEHRGEAAYADYFAHNINFYKNALLENIMRVKSKHFYYELEENDITEVNIRKAAEDNLTSYKNSPFVQWLFNQFEDTTNYYINTYDLPATYENYKKHPELLDNYYT